MEMDCNLKKIGPQFFKFSLLCRNRLNFFSRTDSLHFFLEFSENHFVDKKMPLVLILAEFDTKVTKIPVKYSL